MPFLFEKIWNSVSNAGINAAHTPREKKGIILLNRAWFVLVTVQLCCLVSHIMHGMQRTAWLTAVYIGGLCLVHLLMRKNHVNIAKIAAIVVINYNTVIMGIFLGVQTNVIDFLLLTALMPLYLFETKNKNLIFLGIFISVVPFTLYHYLIPHLSVLSLPVAEQLQVFQTTNWVKIFSLVTLLYLIYNKNTDYEKEVIEKEQLLEGQKKLYERILEQIPIDIVTFDKQLRYTYINSAAVQNDKMRKRMLGKTNVEYFMERNLDTKIAEERDRILYEALLKEKLIETEETMVNRHGKIIHTIKGASPIYNESKELLCLVGYSLDVTRMKEAEGKLKSYAVQLEQKNEDLLHFANATSHDLKTPLRSIASYLQLLEKKNTEKLDDDSKSLIAHTVKSVKHLNQLISDIYQYSIADRHDKSIEVTDLNDIVANTIRHLEHFISEKNADIQYSKLPLLKMIPSHAGMIFSNLLSNAIKYNHSARPQVIIGCEVKEDEYIIRVADNGIGISEEYQSQIFEIFRRLHSSEEYEGTGVGLAICKRIIANYGGKIWVESESGRGAVFYFSLSKASTDPSLPGNIFSLRDYAKTA